MLLSTPLMAEILVQGTPRWGFDGKARVGQFNLISIEVANDSDQPWEGNFEFSASQGFGSAGIPVIQPSMFIEGYGTRELQFIVYIPQLTEFRLSWGRQSGQSYQIDEPVIVEGNAITQLVGDLEFGPRLKEVGSFEETSFPNSAAGLEGLGAVLLDHVPRFNDAQKQAFIDWLRTGGEVHIYHETAGTFPEFPQRMSELNTPVDESQVGSGRVIRHATTLQQSQEKYPKVQASNQSYPEWQLTGGLFSLLKEMTQPDHNWPLIYFMAILYLLLLFPGCWLLGRKRGDYRVTYGAIMGVVVLFSMGFHTVGSRGYGEKTMVNSFALAKLAGNGRLIVTQWSNMFITKGGVYEVKHAEEGLIYSTGQTIERVPGNVLNRPAGRMITDIPSFSGRTILHTGVLKTSSIDPEVQEIKIENNSLQSLKVKLPESLDTTKCFQAFALYGNNLYGCNLYPGLLTSSGYPTPLMSLEPSQWQVYEYWGSQNYTVEQYYEKAFMPIIAYDLGLKSDAQNNEFTFTNHKIRIYIYADMPKEFFAPTDISTQQVGRVVYTFDIPAENVTQTTTTNE